MNTNELSPYVDNDIVKSVMGQVNGAVAEAQASILMQTPPEHLIKTRVGPGGKTFKYLPHAQVTAILNLAFGWRWNWEILHTWFFPSEQEPEEVVVQGRLTVETNGVTITKEQFGQCSMMSGGKRYITIGDGLKGASSDALRKCASLLGVALSLYAPEDDLISAPEDLGIATPNTKKYTPQMIVQYAKNAGYPLNIPKAQLAFVKAVLGKDQPLAELDTRDLELLYRYLAFITSKDENDVVPGAENTSDVRKAVGKAIVREARSQEWQDAKQAVFYGLTSGDLQVYVVDGKWVCEPLGETM